MTPGTGVSLSGAASNQLNGYHLVQYIEFHGFNCCTHDINPEIKFDLNTLD